MKWLILEHIKIVDGTDVLFRIHDQSHVYHEFGDNGSYRWKSHNGLRIYSMAYPQMNTRSNEILVRGDNFGHDHDELSALIDNWTKIKEAVQEYNYYYGYDGECIIGEIPEPILPEEMFTL